MRLGRYGKILHWDTVKLGEGIIDRFTFFEFKPLGGIILNIFNSVKQDRFHTHAFNAVSIMFKGHYMEGIKGCKSRRREHDIKYLPKTLNHKILQSSKNAMSLTIMGPWDKTWTETFETKTREYRWGRKRI